MSKERNQNPSSQIICNCLESDTSLCPPPKPHETPPKPGIEKEDFITRLKKIIDQCKCKPCDCITGQVIPDQRKPKNSKLCPDKPSKRHGKDCSCEPCDCLTCSKTPIVRESSNEEEIFESAEDINGVKKEVFYSVYERQECKCNCKPCECVTCKFADAPKQPPKSTEYAKTQTTLAYKTNITCHCKPCECLFCTTTSKRECKCNPCKCEMCQLSLKSKPYLPLENKELEPLNPYIDISPVILLEEPVPGDVPKSLTFEENLPSIYHAIKRANYPHTYPCRTKNKCECSPCECTDCEKLKTLPPNPCKCSEKRLKPCGCDPCQCEICVREEEPENIECDCSRTKTDSNSEKCDCEVCNCVTCHLPIPKDMSRHPKKFHCTKCGKMQPGRCDACMMKPDGVRCDACLMKPNDVLCEACMTRADAVDVEHDDCGNVIFPFLKSDQNIYAITTATSVVLQQQNKPKIDVQKFYSRNFNSFMPKTVDSTNYSSVSVIVEKRKSISNVMSTEFRDNNEYEYNVNKKIKDHVSEIMDNSINGVSENSMNVDTQLNPAKSFNKSDLLPILDEICENIEFHKEFLRYHKQKINYYAVPQYICPCDECYKHIQQTKHDQYWPLLEYDFDIEGIFFEKYQMETNNKKQHLTESKELTNISSTEFQSTSKEIQSCLLDDTDIALEKTQVETNNFIMYMQHKAPNEKNAAETQQLTTYLLEPQERQNKVNLTTPQKINYFNPSSTSIVPSPYYLYETLPQERQGVKKMQNKPIKQLEIDVGPSLKKQNNETKKPKLSTLNAFAYKKKPKDILENMLLSDYENINRSSKSNRKHQSNQHRKRTYKKQTYKDSIHSPQIMKPAVTNSGIKSQNKAKYYCERLTYILNPKKNCL